ncbi:hypothetical protein CPC08DRAFT_311437 [Agrocybe pediades]|nr:hypothetical protein CPC08DRAFT_311437 [Agrocybe pediades]
MQKKGGCIDLQHKRNGEPSPRSGTAWAKSTSFIWAFQCPCSLISGVQGHSNDAKTTPRPYMFGGRRTYMDVSLYLSRFLSLFISISIAMHGAFDHLRATVAFSRRIYRRSSAIARSFTKIRHT